MVIRARTAARPRLPGGHRLGSSLSPRSGLILIIAGSLAGCAHFQARPLSPQASISGFESRSLTAPGLRAFLAANHLNAPASDSPWSLRALTLTALYYQPALAEARERLLLAQAARITAGERPNPSVSFGPGYDAGVPGALHPWIVPLSFDWPIQTAGKRGYRLSQARELAVADRWDLVGSLWQVRSQVRAALLGIDAARREQSLLAREEATRQQLVELLAGQLRAGNVSSYELAQARIALIRATLAREDATGRLQQQRLALAQALGLPVRALHGVRLSFTPLRELPQHLDRARLRRRALLDRADVRAALARYAAAQSALQLQIARQWPDIHLGPGFTWDAQLAGDRQWQLGLTLPLPVLNHNQGPIAEARAQRSLAAAHFLTVQAAALAQIDSALAAYDAARARLTTANSLLRTLAQQLKSVRAQVQAGELQPLDLADARLAYEAGARSGLEARIRAQQALGRLQSVLQSPIARGRP